MFSMNKENMLLRCLTHVDDCCVLGSLDFTGDIGQMIALFCPPSSCFPIVEVG